MTIIQLYALAPVAIAKNEDINAVDEQLLYVIGSCASAGIFHGAGEKYLRKGQTFKFTTRKLTKVLNYKNRTA